MKPPILTLAIPSLLLFAPSARAEIVERVVAKVNGEIITLSEFVSRQVAAAQAARVTEDRLEPFLRENNARILQEAIDDILLVQRAAEIGLRLRADYIDEVVENIKKENNITSDEALQDQLRREGMTLDGLKRNIERSILRRQVLSRELEPKASVSEADVRAEYAARSSEYERPGTIRLQEILIPGGEGAATRAGEIVTRARAGDDFGALARAHSASPTAGSGGDLGLLARGDLNPEVERNAFALGPGEVSEPLALAEGYRIFKVTERTEGGLVPFDDAKEEIRQRLYRDRWTKGYGEYLESLRKAAIVDVRVREVPLQVDLPSEASPLLEPPPSEAPGAPPGPAPARALPAPAGGAEDEFATTPQAAPERVTRPGLPGEKPPQPEGDPKDERKDEKDAEPRPPS